MSSRTAVMDDHSAKVAALRAQYANLPPGARVRLAKPTSNLFRFRGPVRTPGLDVGGFDQVLRVDPQARTAEVGGMTTYEYLVDATLKHNLMPMVVPQLKTITLGGAVSGLGIESSSFRNGLPHESVREMEILTGDGRVITATPSNEHAELFRGFPNSYGTLGYALRLLIDLEPVKPFVRLRHVRFRDAAECTAALIEIDTAHRFAGEPVHFVDGTVFGKSEIYLTLAAFVDHAPDLSDYTGIQIYYRSIRSNKVDYLTTRDYLWRWDTDWFWCSRAFGVQNPTIRRLWPKRLLRSDVYRKLIALDRQYGVSRRAELLVKGRLSEPVIQDVEIPVAKLPEFLDFFHREVGISPIWLCPLKTRSAEAWPLYPLDASTLYVNVGFWSTVPLARGQREGTHNRRIEQMVSRLGGHKSLYSTSYYSEDEFWSLYNGDVYRELKKAYDREHKLPDLYEKCVRGR